MAPSETSVSNEVVHKALEGYVGHPQDRWSPLAMNCMRAALEAVWPEPTFTPDEVTELIFAAGHSGRGGNLRALESAYAKLLEMERANHA